MTEMHPDPAGDTGQKAAQYVQLVVMAAEAVAVIAAARASAEAERDEAKAAETVGQLASNHKAAAELWEPALADHKRDKLDVSQTLTAWASSQAWKATDPAAERASKLAEVRLHDLRPAGMMRYNDLRSQGLDPVTAMRQVVPLLETDPRIGEPGVRAGAHRETLTSTDLGQLDVFTADPYASQMLYAEATGTLANRLPEGLADSTTVRRPVGTDSWAEAAAESHALRPVDVREAIGLLVNESELLTEIEAHRTAAAQQERLATEQATQRELAAASDGRRAPLFDQHVQVLSAGDRHLSVVIGASTNAAPERTAEQALTASFPTAVTQVPAVTARLAKAPVAEPHAAVTGQAPKPILARRR